MTCSIQVNRKAKPESEVKYVDVDEEFDINVENCLLDLYEKVGILKQRIERLENERRG